MVYEYIILIMAHSMLSVAYRVLENEKMTCGFLIKLLYIFVINAPPLKEWKKSEHSYLYLYSYEQPL